MKRELINVDHVVQVALYSDVHGNEQTCKHFGLSDKTVRNYRSYVRGGRPACAALYQQKEKLRKERMDEEFIRYLRRWCRKLDELVQQAPLERMRDVAGAIKIVGDLSTVREVFGGQQPEPDREGTTPPEAEGSPGDSASEQVH